MDDLTPLLSTGDRVPVAGLLLAAGRGERFRAAGGKDKLTAQLPDGRVVVLEALRRLQAALAPSGEGPVVAVVRAGRDDLADLLRAHGAAVVVSARAERGMGASLADGVAGWPDGRAVIVALGDMPGIAPATLVAVAEALHGGASIVRPRHRGQGGHPVGFAPVWLPALRALDGDAGARAVLQRHRETVRWLEVPDDPGCLADVDTPADLVAGVPVSSR
ncbi:NTP transferase domain-containing protein [Sphaerotilus sp.]|uniref:nucleotidyltransferase family protein n=1 Tax=Sphaerotilus sp. TaxID=2093942 RepID=UPI0034E2B84E